jgi:hypothetical protein
LTKTDYLLLSLQLTYSPYTLALYYIKMALST